MTELLRLEAPPIAADTVSPRPMDGISLPPEQNPLYPDRPWYALPTGRTLPDGRPGMFFVSANIGAGAFLGHVDSFQLGEQTLQMDPAIFEMARFGPNARSSGPGVLSTVAQGGEALPEGEEWKFARYAGGDITDPATNRPYLQALIAQIRPSILNRIAHLGDFPLGVQSISDVEVRYVSHYGQRPGRIGNGRRIAIEYTLNGPDRSCRYRSDISDLGYVDPTRGGMLLPSDAVQGFADQRIDAVDHVLEADGETCEPHAIPTEREARVDAMEERRASAAEVRSTVPDGLHAAVKSGIRLRG
ncbi:MAG: hypothetical protein AAF219_05930 [Myxococcota bacterium]